MYIDLPDLGVLTTFDDALREAPVDADVLARAVEKASVLLAEACLQGEDATRVRLLGYLGNACRVLGRHDEAVAALAKAVTLARGGGDDRASLVNRLRLGEARKYRGDVTEAEAIFRQALRDAQQNDNLTDYRDFALQHLGKRRLEKGDAVEATLLLEQALELRRRRGDPRLIASTELALARACAMLHQQVERCDNGLRQCVIADHATVSVVGLRLRAYNRA